MNEIATILGVDPIEALGFDHENNFNNCSQEGNIGINHINLPDKLIEQYEKRIEQLESEVLFLRALVK